MSIRTILDVQTYTRASYKDLQKIRRIPSPEILEFEETPKYLAPAPEKKLKKTKQPLSHFA